MMNQQRGTARQKRRMLNEHGSAIRAARRRHRASWIVALLWLGLAGASLSSHVKSAFGWAAPPLAAIPSSDGANAQAGESTCIACHRQEGEPIGQIVKLHLASTHGKANFGCQNCHGGDASQPDKARAHALNFTGKPDADGLLLMCGQCHRQPVAQFKISRHLPVHRGIPRLDCAECHGVHSIGTSAPSFSFVSFCAACHGLEYLPELPRPIQDLLTLSDDLQEAARLVAEAGRAPSAELIAQRKELRRLTAEIVHPTDIKGGLEKIPRLLEVGAALKQQFAQERNRKP
jgi:hypothetical protein